MGKKLLLFVILVLLLVGSIASSKKRHSKHRAAALRARDDNDDDSTVTTLFRCGGPKEESGWTYYPNFTTIACSSNTYLGPFGEDGYISTTLNTASMHNGIIFTFSLALIDSWDGEVFEVTANSHVVYAAFYIDNENSSDTCGNDWDDNYMDVKFGFNHSASSVTLKLTSTLDQDSDDEAWGICDLTITLSESYVNSSGYELDVDATGEISDMIFNCKDPAQDDAWIYSPAYGTFHCNDNYYLGGFGASGSIGAVFSIPDDHQNVVVSFQLALIDSWDGEEFFVFADGITVYTLAHSVTGGSSNTCQNGWNDYYIDVQFGFSHNGKYLTLEFTSSLDQGPNDEAWGICNLTIVATSGNIDSEGDYIGSGTGDSIPGSFFSCSSPSVDEGWSYSPYYKTITCDGDTYLGGYGSDGEVSAVFSVSDDHNGIVVSLKLALLDSWEGEDFIVTADGTQVYSLTYNYADSTKNTCGAAYNDNYEDVKFGFNHTADSLTLVFASTLDQDSDDESWGICDLKIKVSDDYVASNGRTVSGT